MEVKFNKAVLVFGVKGGIGKSVISATLALKLKNLMPTILLDADVASPNLPEILKVSEKIEEIGYQKRNAVLIEDGLDFFSMGLFAGESLVAMRSIQYISLLSDIIKYTKFNVPTSQSCLIVDCPAGIDDIHRGIVELLAEKLCGAVIVTTPSSLTDCKRAVKFCEKYGLPILSIVENMAYFKCPDCGSKYYVFGEPSAYKIAKDKNIPYYQVPLIYNMQESIEIGLIEIPDELDFVASRIAEIVYNAKVAKDSIFSRIKKKFKKLYAKEIAKAVALAVKKINTEFNIRSWIEKGYGESKVEVIFTSDGEKVLSLCFMIDKKDAKLKIARAVENPDITLVIDIQKALEIVAESKRLGRLPKEMIKEAVLSGDVMITGDSAMIKSLEFIEEVYPVIAEELYRLLSPVIKIVL